MRTQTLNRHLNFKTFAKGSHVKGHLNGLLFVVSSDSVNDNYPLFREFVDTVKLKVKYVEDRVRTLVPSIPVHNFIDITNSKYGSTNEVGMQKNYIDTALIETLKQLDQLNDSEQFDIVKIQSQIETTQSQSNQIQFFVDLGSIYVDGGNELHYELSGDINTTLDVEVYALSKENEPSHFYEYDMDSDRNELHQNVIESYLCAPSRTREFANIELTVDATSVQYESNTKGLLACTALFGKVENVAIGRTLPVFKALDSVPEDVQVKFISNEDISGYYVLNMRVDTTFKGYVEGKRKAITEKAEVIKRLEVSKPELAEVLQSEGLPTSTELKERVL